MEPQEQKYDRRSADRRKGNDAMMRIISLSGAIGWLIMLIALIMLDKAKPKQYESMMGSVDRGSTYGSIGWNEQILYYVFGLMVLGFFASLIGLLINSSRQRRKTDSYRLNLIALLIISVIGIIYYLA